ncbi:alpha/beta fold hydrolase, partial [Bifidobacterium longum]
MAQLQPYCAIEGNDDGLPVVFVHGMGVDHRSLMMLDKAFDGNDSIRRIYLDLPGFGRTPALPEHACGLPEMADWLQTAIDGLVGKAAPFAMVGNSMGGAL